MVGSTELYKMTDFKIKNGGLKKNCWRTPVCKTGEYSWPAQMKKEDITLLEVVWYKHLMTKLKVFLTV
jgi:hypothetical protein